MPLASLENHSGLFLGGGGGGAEKQHSGAPVAGRVSCLSAQFLLHLSG